MSDEEYLLICLVEECSEVIKEATKILRFGGDGINPKNGAMNRVLLSEELTDVVSIAKMLVNGKVIPQFEEGYKVLNRQNKVMMYVKRNRIGR